MSPPFSRKIRCPWHVESRFVFWAVREPPPRENRFVLAEGRDAGDGTAEDKGMDLVRSLVGPHALQVAHVAHGRGVERDTVAAERGAGLGGDLYRLPDVVELAEADLLGLQRARVFHPSYMKREERSLADLDQHVRELLLHELERGYGPSELLPLLRVGQRRFVAVPRRPHRTPDDPVPRLVQAGEGPAETLRLREH